ncbi:hypothetical protein KKF84_22495 [Myxococcota bacterium]|nr:hypothetical protein [Myxococcota bacterium]
MEAIRYGSLKILTDCSHCGSPVTVNGPQREVLCTSCHRELPFPEETWNHLFRELDQFVMGHPGGGKKSSTVTSGESTLKVTMTSGTPSCSKCQGTLELGSSDAFTGETRCQGCGETTSFVEAPSWLEESGSMKVIGGESEPASRVQPTRGDKPIAMNCPNCSGSLKITESLKRVTNCEFCGTEFFIPDAVWSLLHPVTVARNWFVRFEGTPKWLLQRQRGEALKQQRREQEKKHKEYNKAVENLSTQINKLESGSWGKYAWGYFAAFMVGMFAIGFPILFISPLSKMVGQKICDGEYQRRTFSSGNKTSIKFYCKKGASVESLDAKMFLFGPGAGILFLATLWTLCIPVFRLKARKKANILREQINNLKATGPPQG